MAISKRDHAWAVLSACSIPVGANFYSLSQGTVESLLAWARHDKYRCPKNANGSTARYYHEKLQREAAREPD